MDIEMLFYLKLISAIVTKIRDGKKRKSCAEPGHDDGLVSAAFCLQFFAMG
jgi:hypothetical protein